MGSAYQFHSWRVFVLVCAFPSVFAIGALTTQPESPRFFLEVTGMGLSWEAQRLVCSDTHYRFGYLFACCSPFWGLGSRHLGKHLQKGWGGGEPGHSFHVGPKILAGPDLAWT